MLSPINVLTFIFIIWHVDCSVIIHQTGVYVGDDCYECGEQLVLSCKIDSYSISMSWQNDSSSVPFAQCVIDTCSLDQDVANNFVFSANTSTGIFNLTFNVSIYNNGTTYMCSDGSTTYSSLVLTKDYRPTFNNTISGQLIAMSGCVNKDAIVQFKWELEDGNIYSPTYIDDNQSRDEISCSLDTECGAANSIKHVRTIEVEQGGARGQRLKVIVSYDGFSVGSFLTEEKYIVNGSSIPTTNKTIVNATNGSVELVMETTSFTNNNTSYYTQTTSVDTNDKQNQSAGGNIALYIGGGIVLLIFCLTILIYCCRIRRCQ